MHRDPETSRSYYAESSRKSELRCVLDQVAWLLRHGEVNPYYFVQGLDRQGVSATETTLPYGEFRRLRNGRNFSPPQRSAYYKKHRNFNFVCLTRDKFLFGQLVSSLGLPTPRNLAICDAQGLRWLDTREREPLEALAREEGRSLDAFCKDVEGITGRSVFPVRIEKGRIEVEGRPCPVDELRARLRHPHLLQERVTQHEHMSRLYPLAVNTLRLVTFNRDGQVELFSSALRIGAGGSHTDNWAAGGIIVGVDPERGVLRKEGFFKPGYGTRVFEHPETRVRFDGYEIPHFDEALSVVRSLHELLPGLHSVGWDVAITRTGPTLVEGNDDWEGGIPMTLDPDFKRHFLRMFE